MGLGIVLLFWGVVGLIGASIGSLVLPRIASHFTRATGKNSRRVILVTRLFLFACLVWGGGTFVAYAIVNEAVFHRDPGIGDGWSCPLPNGYALEMIDVTDRGIVYNPRSQRTPGVMEQEDALFDVRSLQIAGPYILAGVGRQYPSDDGPEKCCMNYFLLDTRTGRRTKLSNYDGLREAAARLGAQPSLETIDAVYTRYRFTWFDGVAALTMFSVPLLCGGLLLRWIIRLRSSETTLRNAP